MEIKANWTDVKSKELPISYVDRDGNYYLFITEEADRYTCIIDKLSADAADFEANYKEAATSKL